MDSFGDLPDGDATQREDGYVPAFPQNADPALDARLTRLLLGGAEADPEGPLPDPARVASHLAGVGDQELLHDAAARPSVRRLLAEVAGDSAAAEAEFAIARAAAGAKGHVAARPDEATFAAAMAAFDASLCAPACERGERDDAAPELVVLPGRSATRSLPRRLAWAAAAAVLVAVPLTLASRSVEAGPVLALAGVERLDATGAMAAEGPRRAGVGDRFDPAGGERMSLRLPGGARVVLAGGAAHVAEAGKGALLALDRGEAVLAAGAIGGAPALLRLPDGARLEAVAGAAHVAVRADGAVAVEVRGGGTVRWTPAVRPEGGSAPAEVHGPAAFLLPRGAREIAGREGLRKDAEALFRDLQFFGGDFTPAVSERWTTARFWRVLAGTSGSRDGSLGGARVSDAGGVPALRFDLAVPRDGTPGESGAQPAEARIAWRPDEEALRADRLVVWLRVRPVAAGAGGLPDPDAPPARVAVVLLDGAGSEVSRGEALAVVAAKPAGDSAMDSQRGGRVEDAPRDTPERLELALPADFASRASQGELVLAFRGVAAASTVWFTGASFKPAREDRASE